jgi:hypothetical protein
MKLRPALHGLPDLQGAVAMKARIEKKLSKRLVQLHPAMYRKAWRDDEQSELAYEQGSSVRHCLSVGGGTD